MSNHVPCGKTLLNRSELHRKLQVKYHLSYQNRNKTKPQKTKTHTPWRQGQLTQVLNTLGKIYFH